MVINYLIKQFQRRELSNGTVYVVKQVIGGVVKYCGPVFIVRVLCQKAPRVIAGLRGILIEFPPSCFCFSKPYYAAVHPYINRDRVVFAYLYTSKHPQASHFIILFIGKLNLINSDFIILTQR